MYIYIYVHRDIHILFPFLFSYRFSEAQARSWVARSMLQLKA